MYSAQVLQPMANRAAMQSALATTFAGDFGGIKVGTVVFG
jgi:hypothetical protein